VTRKADLENVTALPEICKKGQHTRKDFTNGVQNYYPLPLRVYVLSVMLYKGRDGPDKRRI
jgi:hypothetical protein